MILSPLQLALYPWSKQSRVYLENWHNGYFKVPLVKILKTEFGLRAMERASDIIASPGKGGGKEPSGILREEDVVTEIASYIMVSIFLRILERRGPYNRVCEFYGETLRVGVESDIALRETLMESMSMPGDIENNRILVNDYVRMTSWLSDPGIKIVNQVVMEGVVKIDPETVPVLMKGWYIYWTNKRINKYAIEEELMAVLRPMVDNIWGERKFTEIKGGNDESTYPPCIQGILNKIRIGIDTPHHERFAVTAFLCNIGISILQIMEMFSASPVFDANATTYQLSQISGKYICPNCKTMRVGSRLCTPNVICSKITNPLQYYRILHRK